MYSSGSPPRPLSNLPFTISSRGAENRHGLTRPFEDDYRNPRDMSPHPSITPSLQRRPTFHGESLTRRPYDVQEALKPPASMDQDSMSSLDKFAPTYLFGNRPQKRRSLALGPVNTPSPLGILRNREEFMQSPGNKSVHWSPALVRTRTISSQEAAQQEVKVVTKESEQSSGAQDSEIEFIASGPPRRSLVREPPSKMPRLPTDSSDSSKSRPFDFSQAASFNGSVFDASNATAPDQTNGVHQSKDFWLTVFGFPKDQVHEILSLFARHGNIVAHKTSEGNWVHIRYSSIVHVTQALSRNLQTYHGYMIGVVPCTDKELAESDGLSRSDVNASVIAAKVANGSVVDSSFTAPIRQIPSVSGSGVAIDSPSNRSRLSSSMRAGMRPLNASLMSESLNISLEQPNQPKKNESYLGKLWNFVAQ